MLCARNIITANFSGGGTSTTTAPLWQWDYGQVLCITGIDLPAAFEVHFSTNRTGGVSTTAVGADGQVTIPNGLLTIGKNLNAWIYLSDSEGEGETEYSITIPVKARPMPEYYDAEVTGEFDDVVRQVSEYAETAQTAADNAGASATAAAASADSAAASASAAETAKNAAETAQGKAEDAQAAAETAAQTATEKAQQTEQDAAQAALDAGRAESAADRAEAAQTGAEAAKAAAEAAAQGAADSATTANEKATLAVQSATAAAQSAASIEGDVQTATAKAAEATAAANQAVAAKDAAVTAQQGAETSATNAGQSASTATAKAAEAAQIATDAAASESAAEAAATRAEQAAASLTVDSALSDTSVNPVQNKVITWEVTQLKRAISEITEKSKNLIVASLEGCTIGSSGSISQLSGKDLYIAPITQGETYTFTSNDTAISGFFIDYPALGSVAYDNTRHLNEYTFTAPITGYVVFRTNSGYQYAQIEKGVVATGYVSPEFITANDKISRDALFGKYDSIPVGNPTSGGFYSGTAGGTISVSSNSGMYYAPIDLSAYVGKQIRVKILTTGTTSTRKIAMCDSNGVIGIAVDEFIFARDGYCYIGISSVYNQLYISHNSTGGNVTVEVVVSDGIVDSGLTTAYVSGTVGEDSNKGTAYAPFKTIQKAVDSGAQTVRVQAGEYAGFLVDARTAPLTVMLNDMPSAYATTTPDVPKIKITSGNGVQVKNSTSVSLSDIWVDGIAADCFNFTDTGHISAERCYASGNSGATDEMGFRIINCNGIFRDCKAWDINKDGFNIHRYGNTEFINCVAYNCGDDGISHHDGCTGLILGGEYYQCNKGGIASPYGGAKIDIHNAYIHDCTRYGIYAMSSTSMLKSSGRISNCVIKDNGTYDIIVTYTDLIGWNNIYDTKSIGTEATFTEF